MKNKIIILLLLLSVLSIGCSKRKIEKIYLDEEYYGQDGFAEVTSDDVNNLEGNYILFVYNNYCALTIPCDEIFKEFTSQSKISVLSIQFKEFKETYLYKTVKYAPSIIVVEDKEINAYLDAESDEDIDKYQDVEVFTKWISNYIYLNKK